MADASLNFEGTDGVTQTTANTGATTVSIGTNATATFAAAMAYSGTTGGKWTTPAAAVQSLTRITLPTTSQSMSFHGVLTTPPSGEITGLPWFCNARYTTAGNWRFVMQMSTRKVFLLDVNSSGQPFGFIQAAGGGDLVLTANTKYRIEVQAVSATTTTGKLDIQIYPATGATTTALNNTTEAASHITTANLGATGCTSVDLGVTSSEAIAHTVGWDEIIVRDNATVIGLRSSTNVPPVASAGANKTATVGNNATFTSADTDTDGTIASRQWTLVESKPSTATAPTIVGSSTAATLVVTANAGGRFKYQHVATDNAGAVSDPSFAYLFVPTTSVKPIEIVGTHEYTIIGSAADEVIAVTDLSDTTGVQSPASPSVVKSIKYRLAPLLPLTSLTASYRRKLSASGTGTSQVKLWQGSTLRYTWSDSPTSTLATATLTHTNGTGDITTITDWLQLDIEFIWGP